MFLLKITFNKHYTQLYCNYIEYSHIINLFKSNETNIS